MEFFYTNEDLANIAPLMSFDGRLQLSENGFDHKQFSRNVSRGNAQGVIEGFTETLIPINDKALFNSRMGSLISLGGDQEYFYKVVSEAEIETIIIKWGEGKIV